MTRTRIDVVAVLGVLALLVAGCADGGSSADKQAAGAEPIAAFTLMAPADVTASQLVARALVSAGQACPPVKATGGSGPVSIPMTERLPGPLAAPAFSTVRSCSANLPSGLTSASIAGASIPAALPATVSKVALVADTGCEVDDPDVQDCKSPTGWPLATIASKVAAAKPDVILDPGDYYYLESACPANAQAKCGGSVPPVPGMPFYESSEGWLQDVIRPMSAMFPVAPMAMLRGNHEDCGRAGNGFFLYLDPRPGTENTCEPVQVAGPAAAKAQAAGPKPLKCPETGPCTPRVTSIALKPAGPQLTPTWAFTLPVTASRTLRLAMVDNAYGSDKELTPWTTEQRKSYQQAQTLTTPTAGRESWLLGHRPIFGLMSKTEIPPNEPQATAWTSDGQMVSSYGLLSNYSMLLSAHLHLTQAVQIPGQPASLVMGNGGADLEPATGYTPPKVGPLANADGTAMVSTLKPYPPASFTWTKVNFGYAIASPQQAAGAWSIKQFDYTGAGTGTCSLAAKKISCT